MSWLCLEKKKVLGVYSDAQKRHLPAQLHHEDVRNVRQVSVRLRLQELGPVGSWVLKRGKGARRRCMSGARLGPDLS